MRIASLVFTFIVLIAAPAAAQHHRAPDTAAQRAAMERLAPLVGDWQGQASVAQPVESTVHQTEQVEWALDGLLLVIRGAAHATADRSGEPVFAALGVISFNERSGVYEVRSYTHEGYVTTATGQFLEDGSFRWGFAPGGPVQMRFTITIDRDSWRELGEMSFDNGNTWTPTVQLDLRRLD